MTMALDISAALPPVEAGRTGRAVNIKKGQFVSPHDIGLAAEKVASTGNNSILHRTRFRFRL